MSNVLREECIALEAANIASRATALDQSMTYGQIADKAIAKVDEWEAKGDLSLLHASWTVDPEEMR